MNDLLIRRLQDDRDTIGELAGQYLRLVDEVTELRDELNDVANHLPGYINLRRRHRLSVRLPDDAGA
jgi:uncharacterized coiled-coil DUF342 family protein